MRGGGEKRVPYTALWLIGCLSLLGMSAAGGCDGDTPLDVRLSSGPTISTRVSHTKQESPIRFVFASVSSPERSMAPLSRFAAYLTTGLGRPVEIVRRRTYAELNELLREGRAQAGLVCTGAYVVGREQFGLREILVPVVGGKLTYRAYLIALEKSPFRSLDDLEGRSFAFSDPLSNTGYRFVAAELRDRQTTPQRYFSRTLFTYSHDNSIQAVRDGIADASTVDSLVWDQLVREEDSVAKQLKIIGVSEPFPINPVVVSPRADAALVRDLSAILLAMASDATGAGLLRDLGIERFTTLPDDRYDAVAESWRELGVLDRLRSAAR